MNAPLTAVSLFAGIEGFGLALTRAGIEVASSVEIDPACRAVIARHFPGTTILPDVKEVTGDQLRAAGLVPGRGILAAGWPCQGNSVAGNRRGMADPRSGLWRHVVRLLDEARPRWFLGENVPGLLGIHNGRDFRTVLTDLDDLGYGVAWRVLDAQFFGVPQRRRRVFIAGCLGDAAGPVQVLLEPESGGWNPPQGRQTQPNAAAPASRRAGSPSGNGTRSIAPTLKSGANARGGTRHPGTSADDATSLIVSTLQGGGQRGHRLDAEGAAGGHLIAYSLNAHHGRNDLEETSISHTLTAEGADASEDGPGHGTPIVTDDTAAVRRLTPASASGCKASPTTGQPDSPTPPATAS
jgi:DNA (cytosine-5)-methyltransferase 1